MPTETLAHIQALCSRALDIWKDAFTMENVVSWMLLAFTAIITLDDWDAFTGVKSVCKEDKDPHQTKMELADVMLTTKGHNDTCIWKRYVLVQIVAVAVILVEDLFLKKNYFSVAISGAAIVMSIITKRNCNRKYDELNSRIADDEKVKEQTCSEQSASEQVNSDSGEMPLDEQAAALLSNTAINEYLDIVRSEYEIERNKKQSFENRAGLIMALIGATCIFVFEQVNLGDVFSLLFEPMTFVVFLKIISGVGVYAGFAFTMYMIIKTISIRQHNNFEVKNIDEELLGEKRVPALVRIIKTYRDIIIQHRDLNEKRANTFRKSLYGVTATLIAIVVYVTLM